MTRPRPTPRSSVLVAFALAACSGGGGGDDDGIADPDATTGAIDAPGGGGDGAISIDAPVSTADPGGPGSWQVHTQATVTITLGSGASVAGTVYSPSSGGATPAPGPFPLIVVSPGFQLARSQYRIFCEHLATWGHVCITRDYAASGNHQDKAREVGKVIDWALSSGSGLATRIDGAAIGVAGHSLGGKVSINAAILDSRIKAVVGWDPVDALPPFGNDGSMSVAPEMMGNLRVPLAVLGQLTDTGCAPSADNYQRYFTAACEVPAAVEVTIAMADHMDWIGDRANCGLACLACSSGQTADAVVHGITRRVTAAWFRRWLSGEVGMEMWWTPGMVGAPATVRTVTGC